METKINYEHLSYTSLETAERITLREVFSLRLPGTFASVKEILSHSASIANVEAKSKGGFIFLSGMLEVNALYMSEENSPVCFSEKVPFETKKKISSETERIFGVFANISFVSLSASSSRSFNGTYTLEALVYDTSASELEVFSSLEGNNTCEILTENVDLSLIKEDITSNLYSFDIPNDSNLTEPLCVLASLSDVRTNQSETGVLVYGVLEVCVVGDREDGENEREECPFARGSYTINCFIEKPSGENFSSFVCDPSFIIRQTELSYDENGSVIRIDFDFTVRTLFCAKVEADVACDLYVVHSPCDVLTQTSLERAKCEEVVFELSEKEASFKKKFSEILCKNVSISLTPHPGKEEVLVEAFAQITLVGKNAAGKIISESAELSWEEVFPSTGDYVEFIGVSNAVLRVLSKEEGSVGVALKASWRGYGVGERTICRIKKVEVLEESERDFAKLMVHFKTPADTLFSLGKVSLLSQKEILERNRVESLLEIEDNTPMLLF